MKRTILISVVAGIVILLSIQLLAQHSKKNDRIEMAQQRMPFIKLGFSEIN